MDDFFKIYLNNNFHSEPNNIYIQQNKLDLSFETFNEVFTDTKDIYFCEEIPLDFFLKKSKKNYYFKIIKSKKRGKRRLKNNSKFHDRNSRYNIICKIKVYFFKSLLDQANHLYNKNLEKDFIEREQFLIPINQKEEKDKNINVEWFFKTAKEYLSSNISGKYNAHDKDYNKNKIDEVFKENKNKDLINFLKQNIKTIYKEYINDEESENDIFKNMRKIKSDLNYMKLKYNYDDDYIKEVKKISKNLEQIFEMKKIKIDQIK